MKLCTAAPKSESLLLIREGNVCDLELLDCPAASAKSSTWICGTAAVGGVRVPLVPPPPPHAGQGELSCALATLALPKGDRRFMIFPNLSVSKRYVGVRLLVLHLWSYPYSILI